MSCRLCPSLPTHRPGTPAARQAATTGQSARRRGQPPTDRNAGHPGRADSRRVGGSAGLDHPAQPGRELARPSARPASRHGSGSPARSRDQGSRGAAARRGTRPTRLPTRRPTPRSSPAAGVGHPGGAPPSPGGRPLISMCGWHFMIPVSLVKHAPQQSYRDHEKRRSGRWPRQGSGAWLIQNSPARARAGQVPGVTWPICRS